MTRRIHVMPARSILAGSMLIVGLGRLGLYTYRSGTIAPEWIYGIGLVIAAIALLMTGGCKAHNLSGRISAALAAAMLLGLAVDVTIKAGAVLNTSALNLYWWSIIALIEVTARHECE